MMVSAGRLFDGFCAVVSFGAALWQAHLGQTILFLGWGISAILASWSCKRDGTGRLLRFLWDPDERRAWFLAFGLWVSSWSR
jgi:hypothetical protein